MNKQERVALAIKEVVSKMMDRVMENVLVNDPFVKEKHHASKPLYAALVPDEIFKGSHFERRFVTPFGGVWEKLAQVVAIEAHGNCSMGHTVDGTVGTESLRRIQEVLNRLEHSIKGKDKAKPDWKTELEYIRQGGGEPIPVSVTCDIFIHNEMTNTKYAFELDKMPSDNFQIRASKEKMFKLLAMNPPQVDFVFYALPYNIDEIILTKWFDIQEDSIVLIGDDFWSLIGGEGIYSEITNEINLFGEEFKKRIFEEYLYV
ncbi:type II restriction endonuclease TdeIII [Arcicella aurantiaca]|uniref:type II site-specific deoxyribonuclease n=1 Tax=Arcicella aurantiaca TaxID=591202 RepID=A0A316DPJ2_9BACT|nr:TdeIII family type II restriction endonuclease [Arcicella aurantiaca]PWK19428.1 type II restriction endonuclease TdeIII [Arcicella aurantiaca]